VTRNTMILLAGSGSLALLAGAFLFQSLGYAPCAMCLWQRWPHAVAIAIAVVAVALGLRVLAWLGAVAALTTGGLGIYHTGVERDWWEGPSSCSGSAGNLGDLDGASLLSMDAPAIVLCDEVVWEFLTLSMASWNAIFSIALAVIWIMAARRPA